MHKLILFIIGFFYGLNVFSQDSLCIYLPKSIYQNKHLIEHGFPLKPSEKITTTDSSFCIIMHSNGRFIELNEKGKFTYEELLNTINQQKLSLTDSIANTFQQLFTDYKSIVPSCKYIVRCPTSRVGDKDKNYYNGIPLNLYWTNSHKDSKYPCRIKEAAFYNLFNEIIFSDTVRSKNNRYTLNKKITQTCELSDDAGMSMILRVCNSNDCSEDLYLIYNKDDLLIKNEYEQFVDDLKTYSALTKIYLRYAFFLSKKMNAYLEHEIISLYQFRNHDGVSGFYEYSVTKSLNLSPDRIDYYNIIEK